jgi:hypothetical protein
MISALIVDIGKMNIVQMVLDATTMHVLVGDIEQRSCSMVRIYRIRERTIFFLFREFYIFLIILQHDENISNMTNVI